MKRQLRSGLVLCIGFCSTLFNLPQCPAAPFYELTEIVSPEGEGIFPTGVNASGRATGSYYRTEMGGTHLVAFFYDGTSVIDLVLRGTSLGHSINDSNQIAGEWEGRAFIWSNGGVQPLGTLGGATSAAYDINNSGQAVGVSENASGKARPFLYSGGQMVELPLPAGFDTGIAFGINDQGQVVGSVLGPNSTSHAALWQNGQVTDLGAFGGTLAQANSINDLGDIVGGKRNSVVSDATAFLLRNNSPQLFAASGAEDINDRGEIIALNNYIDPNGTISSLNDLVIGLGPTPTWRALGGMSINDVGVIVGWEIGVSAGTVRGFLLTPTPEPSSCLLLLVATIYLAGQRRTRTRFA